MDLLVAFRIHEVKRVPVTVEILHLPLVENGAFDVLFSPELVVAEHAGADVTHLGMDEPAFIAGGEMLQIEDPEQVVLELDEHPPLQARCLNRTHIL